MYTCQSNKKISFKFSSYLEQLTTVVVQCGQHGTQTQIHYLNMFTMLTMRAVWNVLLKKTQYNNSKIQSD